jgi:hypothetical protein
MYGPEFINSKPAMQSAKRARDVKLRGDLGETGLLKNQQKTNYKIYYFGYFMLNHIGIFWLVLLQSIYE